MTKPIYPQHILVTNCTQEMIADIISRRDKGITKKALVAESGFHRTQLDRYLRIYDRFGIEAFLPQDFAA